MLSVFAFSSLCQISFYVNNRMKAICDSSLLMPQKKKSIWLSDSLEIFKNACKKLILIAYWTLNVRTASYLKSNQPFYYHLRSNLKRDHFFVKVYFSNVDGLVSYLSRLTVKRLRLDHEIDNDQKFKFDKILI